MPDPPNPYQSPPPTEPPRSWWDRLRGERRPQTITPLRTWEDASLLEFIRGTPIVFEGVAFFLLPEEANALHAAIALRAKDPSLIDRSVKEVERLLPEFLVQFPDLQRTIAGRDVLVRFIDCYLNLQGEVAERIRLST